MARMALELGLVAMRTAGPEAPERYEAASKRFASLLAAGGAYVLWMEFSDGCA
jgi:hypothetical protein